jgi:hypothetical protein
MTPGAPASGQNAAVRRDVDPSYAALGAALRRAAAQGLISAPRQHGSRATAGWPGSVTNVSASVRRDGSIPTERLSTAAGKPGSGVATYLAVRRTEAGRARQATDRMATVSRRHGGGGQRRPSGVLRGSRRESAPAELGHVFGKDGRSRSVWADVAGHENPCRRAERL